MKLSIILIFTAFSFSACVKKFQEPGDDPNAANYGSLSNAKIIVEFESSPDQADIYTAALRYNKDFAISIHIDDGGEDIYTHAYPLLHGSEQHPGMRFTDGCGNAVPFKMSTALYSMSIDGESDLHDPDQVNNFVKWPQVAAIYKKGWGVYNHGLTAASDVDPGLSIRANHEYVKLKTSDFIDGGITMRLMVNPNGDTLFTPPAFEQEYMMALREGYYFGRPYLDVKQTWNKDHVKMGRTNLYGDVNLSELVDAVAEQSGNGQNPWASYYTHSVNNNEWGYDFETFKEHMDYISGKYGLNGMDNMWMSTEEEILDYCRLRDEVQIEQQIDDNVLEITFKEEIPDKLRFYPLTLLLESDAKISSIKVEGVSNYSVTGIGMKEGMINIEAAKP